MRFLPILLLLFSGIASSATTVTPLTYQRSGDKLVPIPGTNISVADSAVAGLYATGSAVATGTVMQAINTTIPTFGTSAALTAAQTIASITASTDATSTLNITATGSGAIAIGQFVTGAGIPAWTNIIAYGTYSPVTGTGTVIMNAAATATASGVSMTTGNLSPGVYATVDNGKVYGYDGTNLTQLPAQTATGLANALFVAKSGSDTACDGKITCPYLTITKALSVATSGTTINIYRGTYTENLTLANGISINADEARGVFIVGNMTASYSGTAYIHHADLSCSTGDCLTVSGANATNLQMDDSHIDASGTATNAINYTNTNASSQLNWDNAAVTHSACNGTLRPLTVGASAAGSIYFEDVSLVCTNSATANSVALGGAVTMSHNGDQVSGTITVANTAVYNGVALKLTNTAGNTITTTSTSLVPSTLVNSILYTSGYGATGTGLFAQFGIVWTVANTGFNTTLSGGAGAQPLPISPMQLYPAAAAPFTCSAGAAGSLAYANTNKYLCYCNGTAWQQASAPASACGW